MSRIGLNIYKRKDGRYEGRFADGWKADGKTKYRSVYGRSYEEVKEKLELVHSSQPMYAKTTDLTVKSLFQEWIQVISSRVKESTISNYCMKAEKHLFPVFGDLCYHIVNANMVHNFIAKKLKSGLSARYVSDIVVLLKSVFKYASRTYNFFNPLVNVMMPKKKKPEIVLLNSSQQKELQKYLQNNQNLTTLGIAVSMYTGLRIGELCALQWKDIDLERRILIVNHTMQRIRNLNGNYKTKLVITEPKSSTSQRMIPIPDCLFDILKMFQAMSNQYVLSGTEKPVEPRTMQYRFAAILKKVNLPSVHFHALRHMFATNCITLGFDVKSLSEILGHSSVEITLNRYVHSCMEQKRAYMERLSFAV